MTNWRETLERETGAAAFKGELLYRARRRTARVCVVLEGVVLQLAQAELVKVTWCGVF